MDADEADDNSCKVVNFIWRNVDPTFAKSSVDTVTPKRHSASTNASLSILRSVTAWVISPPCLLHISAQVSAIVVSKPKLTKSSFTEDGDKPCFTIPCSIHIKVRIKLRTGFALAPVVTHKLSVTAIKSNVYRYVLKHRYEKNRSFKKILKKKVQHQPKK